MGQEKPGKTNGVTESRERKRKVIKGPLVWSQSSLLDETSRKSPQDTAEPVSEG